MLAIEDQPCLPRASWPWPKAVAPVWPAWLDSPFLTYGHDIYRFGDSPEDNNGRPVRFSGEMPPDSFSVSQASPRTLVPHVYVASGRSRIYHTWSSCPAATRAFAILSYPLTEAMAGLWRPSLPPDKDTAEAWPSLEICKLCMNGDAAAHASFLRDLANVRIARGRLAEDMASQEERQKKRRRQDNSDSSDSSDSD
jgi:hypothetical protein